MSTTIAARPGSEIDTVRTSRVGMFVVAGLLTAGLAIGATGAAVFAAHANQAYGVAVNTGQAADKLADL